MKNAIDLEAINMPDIKHFTNEASWQGWHDTVEEMIAELKKMYAREDELLNVLQNVRRGLDDAKWIILEKEIRSRYEWLTILLKIEDSANDAYK